jgi:hypothetical protein
MTDHNDQQQAPAPAAAETGKADREREALCSTFRATPRR